MACLQNTSMECTCTYAACPRHGKCCDCIANHTKKGEFPACFFSKEAEAMYDRSFSMLLKDRGM
jgi:hypothetical protein